MQAAVPHHGCQAKMDQHQDPELDLEPHSLEQELMQGLRDTVRELSSKSLHTCLAKSPSGQAHAGPWNQP